MRKIQPCLACRAPLRFTWASNTAYQVGCWLWLASVLSSAAGGRLVLALVLLFVLFPLCLGLERLRRFQVAPGMPDIPLPPDPTPDPDPPHLGAITGDDPGDAESIVDVWRRIIAGDGKTWVTFRHGTCVVVTDPAANPAEHATRLLREWGPVHPGTSSGDFSVVTLEGASGWVVTGHHPDILNYVSSEDVGGLERHTIIGLLGRAARDSDATAPEVVHVERGSE